MKGIGQLLLGLFLLAVCLPANADSRVFGEDELQLIACDGHHQKLEHMVRVVEVDALRLRRFHATHIDGATNALERAFMRGIEPFAASAVQTT